ncbi:MAG: sigma-70 family RNA polymerase sigma factor [Pseudanabaenaceae cyanobacterium bins.68]|nr:sigma-70 family RNA polymerase sigma factor [Pseudanabaenaceae cyanobacterium bins.68]
MLAVEPDQDHKPDTYYISRCLEGDRHGFSHLYRRHAQKVRSTLYHLCGADTLDDLVQEVFLRAWKGLKNFRQTAQFSTWLYRIAWNVACDRRRVLAKGRSKHIPLEDDSQIEHLDPAMISQLHYQDLVQRGLSQLSTEHRAVLSLHDLEELPQKEIAEILQVPIGTVKSRIFHARAAMRRYLESQGIEL